MCQWLLSADPHRAALVLALSCAAIGVCRRGPEDYPGPAPVSKLACPSHAVGRRPKLRSAGLVGDWLSRKCGPSRSLSENPHPGKAAGKHRPAEHMAINTSKPGLAFYTVAYVAGGGERIAIPGLLGGSYQHTIPKARRGLRTPTRVSSRIIVMARTAKTRCSGSITKNV